MVTRVGIVEHLDGYALDTFGSLDRRHIHERLSGDLLKGSLDHLPPVPPAAAGRVREVLVGFGDGHGGRRATRRQGCDERDRHQRSKTKSQPTRMHGGLHSDSVRAPPYHNSVGRARPGPRSRTKFSRARLAFPSRHLG